MPDSLVAMIDRLVKEGLFQSRTDFILESVRYSLEREKVVPPTARLFLDCLQGRIKKDSTIEQIDNLFSAEDRKKIRRRFKTPEEAISEVRYRQ